jgi:plasmid stabilization system protein ParE
MPRGEKSAYTDKQKRKAEDIAKGYTERSIEPKEAERRAWATVNKSTGGGKKSGSGRGKKTKKGPAKKGGKKDIEQNISLPPTYLHTLHVG